MVEKNDVPKIELFLSANNLPNKDFLSYSDPYCVISLQDSKSSLKELLKTEIIKNNLNPIWKTSLTLDYHFEQNQVLHFSVFDSDGETSESLGSASCALSLLISKSPHTLRLPLGGSLTIRIEELKPNIEGCKIKFRGHKLDKKDFFGKSDPYLVLYKYLGSDSWAEKYRTEIVMKTLNPEWKPLTLSSTKLCNDDRLKPIKVECYDWDRIGKDDFIGSAEINYTQLTTEGFQFQLWGKKKAKGKNSGFIQIEQVVFGRFASSIVDYLQAGLSINLSLAVDFSDSTGSNQGVNLHKESPNQFVSALEEIAGRLEVFDSDKLIPVYGFAGDIGKGTVNNCFALNFNEKSPSVRGIEEAVRVYQEAVGKVQSSWPLNFHNVIDKIAEEAKRNDSKTYHILLIFATGEIDDLDEASESLLRSSTLPVSVVIAGIGAASFNRMRLFEERIMIRVRENGKFRENIQFVRFNTFRNDPIALAGEVLKKIPGHILEFYDLVDFKPLIPYSY